jgi:hypothetical protein
VVLLSDTVNATSRTCSDIVVPIISLQYLWG